MYPRYYVKKTAKYMLDMDGVLKKKFKLKTSGTEDYI